MMSPDTYVGVHPNASADVRMLAVGHGENAARPWHRHRLAERKGKTATGSLTNTLTSSI